jgi:glutamine phosphoribosylpyrophosphate amidotransferase
MCAIIGVNSVDAELTPMVMKEFLVQSQIRGKHATGISYVDNGKIKTIRQAGFANFKAYDWPL